MKTLITVMLKELAEIFRDRKIIINGLLLSPLLFPILILGMGALAENRAKTQLESELNGMCCVTRGSIGWLLGVARGPLSVWPMSCPP